MNKLKIVFLLSALLSIVMFSACSDDDGNCMASDVPENIIGDWSVSSGGNVEFKVDGTLIDPDNALIGGAGLDQKSYVATNTSLTVKAQTLSGGSFLETDFDIVSNECDQLVISFVGAEIELDRR